MTRPTISSTPILKATLVWGLTVSAVITAVAAVIGMVVGGAPGAWSGVLGGAIGALFPALTAVSILVGNRWYGTPNYLQIFFGIVLGGWVLKFIIALVAMLVLVRLDWIVPLVFFFTLVATAVATVVVDMVLMAKMRLPAVSDIADPFADAEGKEAS